MYTVYGVTSDKWPNLIKTIYNTKSIIIIDIYINNINVIDKITNSYKVKQNIFYYIIMNN